MIIPSNKTENMDINMYVIWWVSDGFLSLPSNLAVTSVAFEAVVEEDNIVERVVELA